MRTLCRSVAASAVLVTLLLSGCGLQQSDAVVPNGGLPVGNGPKTPATPITAATITGKTFDWSSTKGHVVVLDFWGSWCVPCRAEQPDLNKLEATWAPKGVVFLGVDVRDNNIDGSAYARDFTVRYPSVNDSDEVIASEYNVSAPPTVIVIDAHGNIADRFLGTLSGVSTDLTDLGKVS
jgi:thiol-disulfide isomerase/thioredoxin